MFRGVHLLHMLKKRRSVIAFGLQDLKDELATQRLLPCAVLLLQAPVILADVLQRRAPTPNLLPTACPKQTRGLSESTSPSLQQSPEGPSPRMPLAASSGNFGKIR